MQHIEINIYNEVFVVIDKKSYLEICWGDGKWKRF